jgi:sec-independent protein translocase protein TatC
MPIMSEELDNLKSMSLGDHLDELRGRLIMIILGIFIGLVICLCFGKFLVSSLQIPYENALKQLHKSQEQDPNLPELSVAEPDKAVAKPAEGATDVEFLRYEISQLKAEVDILRAEVYDIPLTSKAPADTFKIYLKVSLLFGLLLSSPWVIWQIWAFISSGLYKKEKKFAHAVAPASTILFISGVLFFMFVIAPLVMQFFVKFDKMFDVDTQWTLLNYVNMILGLTLVFGVAFQMPIVVVFAERVGLVKIEQLGQGRKFVLLGLIIVSAMATPPDVISQIALAVPLYILYEGSILVCRFMRTRKAKQE